MPSPNLTPAERTQLLRSLEFQALLWKPVESRLAKPLLQNLENVAGAGQSLLASTARNRFRWGTWAAEPLRHWWKKMKQWCYRKCLPWLALRLFTLPRLRRWTTKR